MSDGASNPRVIRVAIADDHPITRQALRQLLEQEQDMQVTGEASSGRQVLDLVRNDAPDVLLLDIDMPEQSGIEVLGRLKAKGRGPQLRILVLSGYPEEAYGVRLLRLGANGYLNKSCAPEDIIGAIRRLAAGAWHITPVMADLLARDALGPQPEELHHQLSLRELQVFRRFAQGHTAAEVARQLSISEKTVGLCRERLMRKLRAQSAAALTQYALKHRLLA